MVKQHEMHKAAEEDKPGGKENHCPNQGNLDYVDLFELSIPGSSFAITTDKTIRSQRFSSEACWNGKICLQQGKGGGGAQEEGT